MPKCWKCGKKGIFLRLNSTGICSICAVIEEREKRAAEARLRHIRDAESEKLLEFRKVFPIVTSIKEIQDLWSLNTCNHDDIEQIHRQQRARLTMPILLNDDSGFFLSSSGNYIYHSSLVSCDCPDYIERQMPCKHMYRLFYELTIGTPITNGVKVIDNSLVSSFYILTPEARLAWVNACRLVIRWPSVQQRTAEIATLLRENFFVESSALDYEHLLSQRTKDALILSLAKKSVTGYRASWSKAKLIDWIIREHSDFLRKEFKRYTSVTVSPLAHSWAEGIKAVCNENYCSIVMPFGTSYI